MGCDSMVALSSATADGATLFAKNSDRPALECQRLVQIPGRRHPAGARLRCQYVDIPEVAETAAVLGSQPYWLWGFEHGVNEHRVAIGNHTVFTREPLGATGLLGMDLVRLGLERGRTAAEALTVVTELIETHGQGGSGQAHVEFAYHNSFLIADPTSAWILETSNRRWAARAVTEIGNASNALALGTDWERGSDDLVRHAVEQGWWRADAGRMDFRAAYADETGVPPNLSAERWRRAGTLLRGARGRLDVPAVRGILRDHYDDAGPVPRERPFDDPYFFSLCRHDPLDNTTAAMVARLPADPVVPAAAWVCLGSPCTGPFLPCYLDARVPEVLGRGGADPDPASPWWRMRELLGLVERDFARWGPHVRARWDAFEAALGRRAAVVEQEAEAARRAGRSEDAAAVLSNLTARAVAAALVEVGALVREIEAED